MGESPATCNTIFVIIDRFFFFNNKTLWCHAYTNVTPLLEENSIFMTFKEFLFQNNAFLSQHGCDVLLKLSDEHSL